MTAQAPDWLVYQGQRRKLFSYPLEPYARAFQYAIDFRLTGSNIHRGYIANWEIRDDFLLLIGLQTRTDFDGPDPGIQLLFPTSTGPVVADWVKMRLRTPEEGTLRYDPRRYGSIYAREKQLWIWKGRLVLLEEFDTRSESLIGSEYTANLEHFFGPEESAFLRAVRDRPEDAAPRLIYADWLDERNDARADVVRLAERVRGQSQAETARQHMAHRHLLNDLHRHELWVQLLSYEDLAAAGRDGVQGL